MVLSLVAGLTWLSTAGEQFLPPLFQDPVHPTPLARIVTSTNTFICLVALVLLYSRRRSVLDLWLIVVLCAWVSELAMLDVLLYSRFTFGFYVGRGLSLITSVVVLVVLLQEMTQLYARLARSNNALQRERDNKLMTMEAMIASLAHEVKQPLGAISINGDTAFLILDEASPDLTEAKSVVSDMVADSHRIAETFDNIRALFGRSDETQERVDINALALDVLRLSKPDCDRRCIKQIADFTPKRPTVVGHKGQLRELVNNLAQNAIEAMASVDEPRILKVQTELATGGTAVISIEDSGPGVGSEKTDTIFDAFVTTKSQGRGLGLAICRMIVERHSGILSVSSARPHGAIFQIKLPSRK